VQPLEHLLNRIRWDADFGRGTFALGYSDRVAATEVTVPFTSAQFDPERPGAFSVEDADGTVHFIPLHRVRTVSKDGIVIWRRAAR
jgi:uncharacterized protein (UPF0248 family)